MEDLSKQANSFKDGRQAQRVFLPARGYGVVLLPTKCSLVLGGEIRVEVKRLTHFLLSLGGGEEHIQIQ